MLNPRGTCLAAGVCGLLVKVVECFVCQQIWGKGVGIQRNLCKPLEMCLLISSIICGVCLVFFFDCFGGPREGKVEGPRACQTLL